MKKAKQSVQSQYAQKITAVYIYLLLIFFLFYSGTGGYQTVQEAKYLMFCVICGGYLAVMVLLWLEGLLVGAQKFVSPLSVFRSASAVQKLAVGYAALTWLSAILSPYWPDTVLGASRYEGAVTITIYVGCFLLVSAFGRATPRMLAVFGAAAALFSILCIAQMAGWNPFGLYPAGYGYADAYTAYSGAYLGTIGNVDLVAAFLCLAIPLMAVGIFRLKNKARLLLFVPLALSLYVLFKMWVLAGLVGVLAGGVLAIPAVVPAEPKIRRGLAVGILLAGVLAVTAVYLVDPGGGLFHELHELLHGNLDAGFGSGRIHIWSSVLERVPSHLWLGTGPDTMIYAGIEPFTRYDETFGLIVSRIDTAHSEYLNILFHQGIFALLAYLAMLILALKKWVLGDRRDAVTAMLGSAVFCYCIQAFFGFSVCITAPFFWLALALLEGWDRQIKEESSCGRNSSA